MKTKNDLKPFVIVIFSIAAVALSIIEINTLSKRLEIAEYFYAITDPINLLIIFPLIYLLKKLIGVARFQLGYSRIIALLAAIVSIALIAWPLAISILLVLNTTKKQAQTVQYSRSDIASTFIHNEELALREEYHRSSNNGIIIDTAYITEQQLVVNARDSEVDLFEIDPQNYISVFQNETSKSLCLDSEYILAFEQNWTLKYVYADKKGAQIGVVFIDNKRCQLLRDERRSKKDR